MTGNKTAMASRSEMMLGKGVEQGYCAAIGDRHRNRPARSIGEVENVQQSASHNRSQSTQSRAVVGDGGRNRSGVPRGDPSGVTAVQLRRPAG